MAENKKSAELKKEEEKALKPYQEYLNGLAQKDPVSSEIFTNKGKEHASILMATLLANTEHNLDMYCQGLRPGILCGRQEGDGEGFEGAYWEEFKKFFSETISSPNFADNSIRILIQNEQWLEYAPFQKVAEALRNGTTKNKITVKVIKPEDKRQIEESLGKKDSINYNFSIYDNKAFRLEYEPDEYQAIGSFNSPSWCELLSNMFQHSYEAATDITDKVRNLGVA